MNPQSRFYSILQISEDADICEVKAAYHRLAKRNHPDLFPDHQRQQQQLKMMRVNEAYMAVLSELLGGKGNAPPHPEEADQQPRSASTNPSRNEFFALWKEKVRRGPLSNSTTIGVPRDPAYSYYKAGFRYYNLGATELFRREAPKIRRHLEREGTTDGYILKLAIRALHYFERSYSYFLVVVEQHRDSPWYYDARWKLRRLEKFSAVYQRICENLARRSSTRRSSFSMVKGADPS